MLILIHLILLVLGSYFSINFLNVWTFHSDKLGEGLSIVLSALMTVGIIFIVHIIVFIVVVLLVWGVTLLSGSKYSPKSKYTVFMLGTMISYFVFFFRTKVSVYNKLNIPSNDENYVLYVNHQAQVDIISVMIAMKGRPCAFLGKPSILKWPFVKNWMGRMGYVPLNNQNDREAAVAIIKGIEQVKEGVKMIIFPSGRRSYSDELGEFKAGAFKLAMKPQATIVPVTVNDSHIAERTLFSLFKRSKCSVTFHKPIRYEEYKELNSQELSDKVRDIIASGIRK